MLPLEKLVDGVLKLVESLDSTDKKLVIRKLVTKIVATKEEITIWGHLPVLAPVEVGYEPINRHSKVLTQLPFELKLRMPNTDRGGRGYSNQLVASLANTLY